MKLILVSLFSGLLSVPAWAGDFYVLDLGDQVMRGQNTIGLKRLMRQQYPNSGFRTADLMSVLMVAKTRGGSGKAKLVVGQRGTQEKTVKGNPNKFKSIASNSYDRLLFKNPARQSRGAWQIKTRGNFNVRQVVVELGANSELLRLNYGGQQYKSTPGGNNVLKLRQKARIDHGVNTRNYQLESITIVGKSRRGRGTATLNVGQASANPIQLAGRPRDFASNDPYTYDRVQIFNPKQNSNGNWQVELKGNIKIKAVILNMMPK